MCGRYIATLNDPIPYNTGILRPLQDRVHTCTLGPRRAEGRRTERAKEGRREHGRERKHRPQHHNSKMSRAKVELKHGPHPAPPVLLCVTLRAVVYPGTLMHPVLNDEI